MTGSNSDGGHKSVDQENSIDRHALVTRHNPVLTEINRLSPLSVGNGEFAFTADITGLQTFTDFYNRDEDNVPAPGPDGFLQQREIEGASPLATQSQWGWHSFPNPEGHTMADATRMYDSHGRDVPYASLQNTPAGDWLRENPHRLNLARIGFELKKSDGTVVDIEEVESVRQELDLWSGTLHSQFEVEGNPVSVETRVHPDHDMLAVTVDASSLSHEQIGVVIAFPYGRGLHAGDPSDWSKPEHHTTNSISNGDDYREWHRILDEDEYFVKLAWDERGDVEKRADHEYFLSFSDTGNPLSFTVAFLEEQVTDDLPDAYSTKETVEGWWNDFWLRGGAIDLSESSDPRAHELERRIVLSQYLMAIQSSGSMPPQETGLTYNSWFGKFHLEMHWWHGVHFALWDRLDMLENSLDWYDEIMPVARAATELQGYEGIRWPKMVSPDGRDSPSGVGVFLVWQQPHPIYYAELVHRQKPGQETLERFRDVVFETADFMASYPSWVEEKGEYVLGPPLIPAQEIFPPEETFNPGFELAYWKFGLETAQQWRERLGLERDPEWDRVLENLSPLPEKDGLYVNTESHPNTFTDANERRDHPTLLGSCGFLPCNGVDREKMRRTLHEVMDSWNWDHTWGWDYPLVAMTAARVGEPDIAIDALMMDVQKNTYLPNGHNYQDTRLTLYLPGNGGVLTAVAMMAGGWDGAPDMDAPGFPQDGSWVVRHEGLITMP
ncbi:glycoside hydrolase family 65 [Rhodohalobacter sp. SW132]|nr:glycoside hydrolase family 65 [Rhodohalobacter sp. SW132]